MRLWHYKLIPVLPNKMLVSQWRECIAIKRQWVKGTLKHRLVSYVMEQYHSKACFYNYTTRVCQEMHYRNIKYQDKYLHEIMDFCRCVGNYCYPMDILNYEEHNDRYLKQCYYNLQEKYDRGIITKEEWKLIEDKFKSEVE